MTRLFAAACLLLAAAGCALMTKPPSVTPGIANPEAWRAHREQLTGFNHWSLQGRVATGKLLGWSGNLSWRQRDKSFDVRLAGPLGAGGFRAQGNLDLVKIRTQDKTFYTNQPETLVAQTLGWRFPLTGLRYWVLGLPAPGAQAQVSVDDAGRLVQLVQLGWQLSYTDYQRTGGVMLPRRIVLDNGENTVKLVIDRWFDMAGSAGRSN